MRDLRLDPVTGDLDIRGNELHLTEGKESAAQFIEGRLSLNLGEWFLNELIGIPYSRDVFKRQTPRSLSSLEAMYRRAVSTAQDIKALQQFSLKAGKDRVLRLSFVALDNDGNTIQVEDFEPGGP